MNTMPTMRTRVHSILAASLSLYWASCTACYAHEGPPYPIIVDEPIPGYLLSVWGDPDVGTGTFYIITDPQSASMNAAVPEVEIWVQPVNRRLPKVHFPASQQDVDGRIQFLAEPQFDRQEMWNVGFLVRPPDGETAEVVAEVEVTPPGYGAWDLLIYLVPFLMFGGLWAVALIRRWRATGEERALARSAVKLQQKES